MNKLTELRVTMYNLPAAPIPLEMRDRVLELVLECWFEFDSSRTGKMEPWKTRRDGGPENLTWLPPLLSFEIDRHGGTVMGSTRAERQRWTLNLDTHSAVSKTCGHRQLRPNSPRLDVGPKVRAVCAAVQRGPASASDLMAQGIVEWRSDDELRVKHSKLIPDDGPRQTIIGRRKKFRAKLRNEMTAIGWDEVPGRLWITFQRRVKNEQSMS
jgi:hypothetical protein